MTRPVGRPSKLTEQTKARLVKALKKGAHDYEAAKAAGIGKTTFYEWIKQGEAEEEGEFRELVDAIAQVEGEVISEASGGIFKAGKAGDWRAFAWWLTHSHPEDWGEKQNVKTEHAGEIKITINKVQP